MEIQNSLPQWKSRVSFIFAASAGAIGLGNIWRFPYMVGQNGGAMFVLIYLVCVIVLGIPLLIGEVLIGRIGRKNPVGAIVDIAKKTNNSRKWAWLGGINILAAFLILSYYVVITGWVLDYLGKAFLGHFSYVTESISQHDFLSLQKSFGQMLISDSIVVFGTTFIMYFGIKQGLERAVLFMFPALLILMLLLLGYAITSGGFSEAFAFLFKPQLNKLSAKTVLLALGQAFFSLNVAMGVTIMFSAYLPKRTPITSSVVAIAVADTLIALLAGLIIFPIVFANHLQVSSGPSLIFQTLPVAFSHIPFSTVISSLFFLMLFFAAFSSVIAVLEPSICWLMETWNLTRHRAVIIACLTIWILSLASISSFSQVEHFQILGVTYFKAIDYLTANIMLPVGGLLIAIFCGWVLSNKLISTELNWNLNSIWFKLWRIILKYIAPIAIFFILLTAIGLL